jgi:hypothetical protein
MRKNTGDAAGIRSDQIQTGNRGGGSGGTDGRTGGGAKRATRIGFDSGGNGTADGSVGGTAGSAAIQLPVVEPLQLRANSPTTHVTSGFASGFGFAQQFFAPGFEQHDSTGASRAIFAGVEQQQADDWRSASVRQPQAAPPQRVRCAADGTIAGKPISETSCAQTSKTDPTSRIRGHG